MQTTTTSEACMGFWTGFLIIASFHATMVLGFLWILRF